MLEQRLKTTAFGWALPCLVLPLLLSECGNVSDPDDHLPAGGTSGTPGQSGAGGAIEVGGAAPSDAGASGSADNAGLGGSTAAGATASDAGAGAAGELTGAAGGTACGSELKAFPSPSAAHVTVCSAIDYPMNPPVYGDHYPVWAAYTSYAFPVPLGFLVHNLEHGAVVLLYNCPQGCSDEVASAQAFIDALPDDPRCASDVKHQVVMSPDPALPARWAAVAWGRSLSAECFAPSVFRAFYEANVGHGSEDICANGAELGADVCQ